MTPNETKLSADLHSKLGVKPEKYCIEYFGRMTGELIGDKLRLTNLDVGSEVTMSKTQLICFEAWLEQIGWRPQ